MKYKIIFGIIGSICVLFCVANICKVRVVDIEETGGGMPCENLEQFQRWYETYEQETSVQGDCERTEGTTYDDSEISEYETIFETEVETTAEGLGASLGVVGTQSIYIVNGVKLSEDLQEYVSAD